jgi:hypothetical protein
VPRKTFKANFNTSALFFLAISLSGSAMPAVNGCNMRFSAVEGGSKRTDPFIPLTEELDITDCKVTIEDGLPSYIPKTEDKVRAMAMDVVSALAWLQEVVFIVMSTSRTCCRKALDRNGF